MDRATSGQILLERARRSRRAVPQDAQKLGIALLPANRKLEGMFSFQSIAFNISAGHLQAAVPVRASSSTGPGSGPSPRT